MQENDRETRLRRSIRLSGYDYSQPGAYFVTIVTHSRACLFGDVVDGEMQLNDAGRIVERVWLELPRHYAGIELGVFCVMPNHIHAVILLNDSGVKGAVGAGLRPAPTTKDKTDPSKMPNGKRRPLSEIVRALKSFSARRINELYNTRGQSIWQRNYYEHIIRNDDDYRLIQQYIESNPTRWMDDEELPDYQP